LLSFWPLQSAGWLLYAVAVVTSSLPLRHQQDFVAFRATFILTTFTESFAMYGLCSYLWRRRVNLFASLLFCIAASAMLGLASSTLSIWSEAHLSGGTVSFRWAYALSGMTGAGFVLFAWSALYFGIKHYLALEEEKTRLRLSEANARDAQLRALRYQLQPHFLFNTLNAISSLVVNQENQGATQMISRLADLLRSTLDRPDVHFASLEDELLVMNEYLAIEKLRFGARLNIVFDVDAAALQAQVPRFLLQPLIENAIRHVISTLIAGGTVTIRASRSHNTIELSIMNDVCRTCAAGPQAVGLGLANTRARIEQTYGAHGSVIVMNETAECFCVTVTIPYSAPILETTSLSAAG
jgi:sensor histidine kinase YesM